MAIIAFHMEFRVVYKQNLPQAQTETIFKQA